MTVEFGVRRSRVLGLIWILAGLALLAAAVLLWLDREQVSWFEAPLGLVGIAVGVHLWSQRVEVDRHGIAMVSRSGTERVLWASVAAVDVRDSWVRPALVIERKSDAARQVVQATSGLSRRQRNAMFDVLHQLGREHGFDVRRDGRQATRSAAAGDDAELIPARRGDRVFVPPADEVRDTASDEGGEDPGDDSGGDAGDIPDAAARDDEDPGAPDDEEPGAPDDQPDAEEPRSLHDEPDDDEPGGPDAEEPRSLHDEPDDDEPGAPDDEEPRATEPSPDGPLEPSVLPSSPDGLDDGVDADEPLDDQPAAP